MKIINCLLYGALFLVFVQIAFLYAEDIETENSNVVFTGLFSKELDDDAIQYTIEAECVDTSCVHYIMKKDQLSTLDSVEPEFLRRSVSNQGQTASLFIESSDKLEDEFGDLYYAVKAVREDGLLSEEAGALVLSERYIEDDSGLSAGAIVAIAVETPAAVCLALLCLSLLCALCLIPLCLLAYKRSKGVKATKSSKSSSAITSA